MPVVVNVEQVTVSNVRRSLKAAGQLLRSPEGVSTTITHAWTEFVYGRGVSPLLNYKG